MSSIHWMALIAGVGVAGWIAFISYALLAPARQPDPQRGQAVGCPWILLIPGIALALLLLVGLATHIDLLTRIAFWIVIFPSGYLLLFGAAYPFMLKRRRKLEAEWRQDDDATLPR